MSNDPAVSYREMSPLTLAFVGDAVLSLSVRKYFSKRARYTINALNAMTVEVVSAHGQFEAHRLIEDELTDTEKDYVRRGKNASKATVAKNATPEEYRTSTGMECMFGYLELTGQQERIEYLTDLMINRLIEA